MWTISCRNKQLFINIFYFSSLSPPLSLSLFRWLPLIYFHSFVRDWRQVDGVKGAFRRLSAGATRPLVGPLISPLPPLFFFFLGARRRVIQTRFVGFVNIFRVALPRLLLRFFFSFPRSLFAAGPLRPKGLSGNWIDISPIQIIISI